MKTEEEIRAEIEQEVRLKILKEVYDEIDKECKFWEESLKRVRKEGSAMDIHYSSARNDEARVLRVKINDMMIEGEN